MKSSLIKLGALLAALAVPSLALATPFTAADAPAKDEKKDEKKKDDKKEEKKDEKKEEKKH